MTENRESDEWTAEVKMPPPTSMEDIPQRHPDKIPMPSPIPGPTGGIDPWAHRSTGMCCRTCMWFMEKISEGRRPQNNAPFGRCRRHSPTMNGYPAVWGTDWCGDHKLDENRR